MSIKKVKCSEFLNPFIDATSKLKYGSFVGFYEPEMNWDCYLTEDKLSGFAISPEKELTCLFNANPDYKFLDDPEVVKIINEEVDWFVSLGYYKYQSNDVEFGISPISLTDYYKSKLNFDIFGTTELDTEDMAESIGLMRTVEFVHNHGLPFQTFFLNKKYPILNEGKYGYNSYPVIKKNILFYIEMHNEED